MELIGVLVVCLFLKAAVVEISYAVRGKPSPRSQMKMAQVNADVKAGKRPTVGFTDFLAMLWNEVWAEAIAKHKAKVATGAAKPASTGPARSFLRNWWNDAWTRAEEKRAKKTAGEDPPQSQSQSQSQQPQPQQPHQSQTQQPQPEAEQPQPETQLAEQPQPVSQTQQRQPEAEQPQPETQQAEQPQPVSQGDGQPLAPVIPLKRPPAPPVIGEVTGLVTAQQFAEDMTTALTGQGPLTQDFIAALTASGVDGAAAEAAARAMVLVDEAGAAWAEVREALGDQQPLREAYAAAPEAGSKQFVTSD